MKDLSGYKAFAFARPWGLSAESLEKLYARAKMYKYGRVCLGGCPHFPQHLDDVACLVALGVMLQRRPYDQTRGW